MAKSNHTHKIMKAGPIWKCVLGCSFFVYFKQDYIILGRDFVCWMCGAEFKLDDEAKSMDMPQCASCRNPEFDDLESFIDKKIADNSKTND